MELPDLTGFCLGDAKSILTRNSIEDIEVILTQATRKSAGNSDEHSNAYQSANAVNDESRVIRVQFSGEGKIRLLVCNIENAAVKKGT